MRTTIMLAVCALALTVSGARADDTQPKETLQHFLARCDAGDSDCRVDVQAGYSAANDMGLICPPNDLTEDQAVDAELNWMRGVVSDSTRAQQDEVDVEYDALNALWPCDN